MVTHIAVFSYGFAAVSFLLLTVLLLTSWRRRLHGMALMLACLATSVWAAFMALQSQLGNPLVLLTAILEILRNAGWTAFLLVVLHPYLNRPKSTFLKLSMPVLGLVLFYALFIGANLQAYLQPDASSLATKLVTSFFGHVGMALVGLLLVEQLYRNTPFKDRWAIKFACLGISGLFAFDFYLYSDAMLFRVLNGDIWAARGVVDALTVPLIAVSAARNPSWSLGIAVSRKLVFHSTALFGAAIYLLAMAAAGYYLRYFGGSWGVVMQVAFLFASGLLLVGILVSGSIRSRLKVFISKNFYSYNYDYREEWLRFTRILSDEGPALGQRAIQAIGELVESSGGALWVQRDNGRYEFLAEFYMPVEHAVEPAGSPLCQMLQSKGGWMIDLEEFARSPERYEGLVLPDWLRRIPTAWLVVPLMSHGVLFGFVVLSKSRSRINLNWEVTDLLKIAGRQAASYLAQQESANALMVARQFESFNRMSTFMVHDLKNLIFQLSLLLSNAEKHKNNPAFQADMLDTLDHSVKKMKLLLQKLSGADSIEGPAVLFLDKLLAQAIASKSTSEPAPRLEIADPELRAHANWARLERVIGHLIQNAIEASSKEGEVLVRLARQGDQALVEVRDQGSGMSEEFIRERLFQPFETTKAAGMGVGAFESREYIHELGGQLDVQSQPGEGTTFRVRLPLYREHDSEAPAGTRVAVGHSQP
ncbi:MAG: XrtA/PEP-CTERM system histidine kinase PrsK [Janthinobacterium lividum]